MRAAPHSLPLPLPLSDIAAAVAVILLGCVCWRHGCGGLLAHPPAAARALPAAAARSRRGLRWQQQRCGCAALLMSPGARAPCLPCLRVHRKNQEAEALCGHGCPVNAMAAHTWLCPTLLVPVLTRRRPAVRARLGRLVARSLGRAELGHWQRLRLASSCCRPASAAEKLNGMPIGGEGASRATWASMGQHSCRHLAASCWRFHHSSAVEDGHAGRSASSSCSYQMMTRPLLEDGTSIPG